MSALPPRLLVKAIFRPSGDQVGAPSASVEWGTFTRSVPSPAIVQMSPRFAKAMRPTVDGGSAAAWGITASWTDATARAAATAARPAWGRRERVVARIVTTASGGPRGTARPRPEEPPYGSADDVERHRDRDWIRGTRIPGTG